MSKELVISSDVHETRVAILEDDQLVEIYFQRANEYSLAGSIHKGRVTRVLPGMQSAFVDLGLERDTFLYVSDFFEENGEEYDRVTEDRAPGPRKAESRRESAAAAQAAPPAAMSVPVPEPAPEAEPEVQPAAVERQEDGGSERDRRGRRSRRRRSRGRGFPESKYASDVSTEAESEFEEPHNEPDEPADVFLLPGESLAKYRGHAPRRGEAASEPVALADADGAPIESVDDELVVESPRIPEEDPEAPAEPPIEEPPDPESPEIEPEEEPEPVKFSANGDNPDPAVEAAAEAVAEVEPEELAALIESRTEAALELEPSIEETEAEEVEAEEAEAEEVDEAEEEVEVEDEDEDSAGEPDELAIAAIEAERMHSEAHDVTEALKEAMDAASEAAVAPAESLTASVREQGGRYQHRQSRRMRRKQRSAEGRQEGERAPKESPAPAPERDTEVRGKDRPPLPSISELLREGQEIIVQIAKEPLGQKGARITSHIALPGRFVVYMPTLDHLGVSRKIASEEERQRLKRILQTNRAGISGGFITRTAAEGRTQDEIAGDMQYLYNLWLDIRQKAEKRRAPALLHHDLDIVHRILRDQLSDMFKAIWIDSEEVYESVLRFMQRFQPALVARVKMYTRPEPIFDAFSISSELEKALRPKVWLKSGGYIVINQTEALVAVDVNTGKFVGKSNRLEDTITKTNTEAVREIVRQIRLRDLGGIIVVDFIDMDERKNRQKVMQALEEAMRADRAPNKILQFNDFGLVAITRKRVKQSLERTLCAPCPVCEGAGYTKNVLTIVGEILQEARKLRSAVEGKNAVLRVNPEVAKFLKSNTNAYLEEIEAILRRPVIVSSDPTLHPEKFDLAW